MVKVTNRITRESANISFFPDDTVETVLQRIGEVTDIHPDRLFVTVGLKRPANYYSDDPRRWESLFHRVSYGGKYALKLPFQLYQTAYRYPQPPSVNFSDFGLNEWMATPVEDDLKAIFESTAEFTEHLIFGTDEALSYILPLSYDPALTSKIPAAEYPIPQKTKLVSTLYPNISDIQEFTYTPFTPDAESSRAVYFPFFQSTTPERLPLAMIEILREGTTRLNKLLELNVPDPKASIVRARFRIPWVETKLGPAIQNRFEQMFYGLTVSESTPAISFFTSPDETSRHKFFVKPGRTKKPEHLDWWRQWWTATKPYKQKPTLVLYRGQSSSHYDRIAITSSDMVLMSFRPEGVETDPAKLRSDLADWIQTLDSVLPFTNQSDLKSSRWELQDLSLILKYKKKLTDYDYHRFNCLTSIFDMSDSEQDTFRLLRTDHSVEGLTSMEVQIIQLLRDKVNVTIADIQTGLGVSQEIAQSLKTKIEQLVSDNPNILNKTFRGFPTMRFRGDTVSISYTTQFTLAIQYANILRFILSNGDASALNKICPARKDVVPAQSVAAPAQQTEINTELMSEYENLFEGMEEEDAGPAKEVAQVPMQEPIALGSEGPAKPRKKIGDESEYNYFFKRLQKFDENTYSPTDSEFPKDCQQPEQPVVLNDEELKALEGTPYDPRNILWTEWNSTKSYEKDDNVTYDGEHYTAKKANTNEIPLTIVTGIQVVSKKWRKTNEVADRVTETEDPKGSFTCPEYWCMTDEIPLRKEDLVDNACPKCKGKIRKSGKKQDSREFSVIEKKAKSPYPVLLGDRKSPINNRPVMCCRGNPDVRENTPDHFYILEEDTHPIPARRCAMLPLSVFRTLRIDEAHRADANYYVDFKDMRFGIEGELHGYFRVGLGTCPEIIELIPRLLGQEAFKIPKPRESPANVIKCSFVASWPTPSDKHVDQIMKTGGINQSLAKIVSGIDEAFEENKLTPLQALEYACACMGCDVFRILMQKEQSAGKIEILSLGCNFYSSRFKKSDKKAIILLQLGTDIDVLSYVKRKKVKASRGERDKIPSFEYTANILTPNSAIFTKNTFDILNKLRSNSCSSVVPTYPDALKVMQVLGETDFSIIADPYGRAQAFYVPYKVILPFHPAPIPQDFPSSSVMDGYTNVKLPTYDLVLAYLSKIPAGINGYKTKEDAYNSSKERTEIILDCGLRIPVIPTPFPESKKDPKEVVQTVQTVNETNLTFGGPDELVKKEYTDISYASEVFDFLLFELSKDIKNEALELRNALDSASPVRTDIDTLLREWFDATVKEVNVSSSEEFITKVRKPCGQFKEGDCKGNVCAWNGNTCQVKVRNSVKLPNLYNRLLSALVSNPKIRNTVLEGRNAPFFSTILYVELPHELIVTDGDLATLK